MFKMIITRSRNYSCEKERWWCRFRWIDIICLHDRLQIYYILITRNCIVKFDSLFSSNGGSFVVTISFKSGCIAVFAYTWCGRMPENGWISDIVTQTCIHIYVWNIYVLRYKVIWLDHDLGFHVYKQRYNSTASRCATND